MEKLIIRRLVLSGRGRLVTRDLRLVVSLELYMITFSFFATGFKETQRETDKEIEKETQTRDIDR